MQYIRGEGKRPIALELIQLIQNMFNRLSFGVGVTDGQLGINSAPPSEFLLKPYGVN